MGQVSKEGTNALTGGKNVHEQAEKNRRNGVGRANIHLAGFQRG
jgi:hypothetical protein